MISRTLLSVFASLALVTLASAEPVKLIFDTDMANDCDDAGALAVLNALADLGEVDILAVVTNRKDPGNASAGAVDAINTYYGRPDIPIGTDKDGAKVRGSKPSSYTSALMEDFPNDAKPDDEMPDALNVYREVLQAQPDGAVVICSVGALSNLEDLVREELDLVKAKVKELYIMGGGFPRTIRPETNIKLDPAAAVTVTNEWPTPIVWQGYEVGAAMSNGPELQEAPEANPVRRSYELRPFHGHKSIDYGKPNHDLATVLLAVRGIQEDLWRSYKDGRAVIDSDGNTFWSQDWRKSHTYVRIKGHPRNLQKVLGDLLVAPPTKK
ncbi:MAG: nucleoside hydrolase [Verrucomicrobiales bacterium]|nr:nucleoside hydrolase [Verrucomicrobiales bacterium]